MSDYAIHAVVSVGFVQRIWRVSEDSGEVILLVESDGRNVDPVSLVYSFQNGSRTAGGVLNQSVQTVSLQYLL